MDCPALSNSYWSVFQCWKVFIAVHVITCRKWAGSAFTDGDRRRNDNERPRTVLESVQSNTPRKLSFIFGERKRNDLFFNPLDVWTSTLYNMNCPRAVPSRNSLPASGPRAPVSIRARRRRRSSLRISRATVFLRARRRPPRSLPQRKRLPDIDFSRRAPVKGNEYYAVRLAENP